MSSHEFFVPSQDIMTSIVFPTIVFCIGMVVAMLVGINKCKQWELDKIVEMRRTRRVIQRVTNRLREKNFKTIQKARSIRKQANKNNKSMEFAPPAYSSHSCGSSPPPSYEDALLEEYYHECHPSRRSRPVPDSPRRRYSRPSTAQQRRSSQKNSSGRKGKNKISH